MKKLATVLIIIGILIMLSPIAGGLYTQYQENKMIDEWLESSTLEPSDSTMADADPEQEYKQLQESFDGEDTESPQDTLQPTQPGSTPDGSAISSEQPSQNPAQGSAQSTLEPTPKPTPKPASKPAVKQEILGVIIIDKIKIKCPIVEGVKKENLSAGIGHIPGTAMPGQMGNCALAGHRSHTFGKFFNRLDDLKEGDEIKITTKSGEYKYTVFEKLVVTPDDVSVLKGFKDDYVLTLITCTPLYVATHRLVLHARLENPPAPAQSNVPAPSNEVTPSNTPDSTNIPSTNNEATPNNEAAPSDVSNPSTEAIPNNETISSDD